MFGILKGYKTYIVALLTILSVSAAYLDGDMHAAAALQAIITAVLSITIRHGVSSAIASLADRAGI